MNILKIAARIAANEPVPSVSAVGGDEMNASVKAEHIGQIEIDADSPGELYDRWHVTGDLNGQKLDAILETEIDGREAWWVEEISPCETAGVIPGDENTGWDTVLMALNDASS